MENKNHQTNPDYFKTIRDHAEAKKQLEAERQNKPIWIRVSQAGGYTPFSVSLFYKWSHRGEHKDLFSRVGKNLFVDVAGVNRMIDAGQLSK